MPESKSGALPLGDIPPLKKNGVGDGNRTHDPQDQCDRGISSDRTGRRCKTDRERCGEACSIDGSALYYTWTWGDRVKS